MAYPVRQDTGALSDSPSTRVRVGQLRSGSHGADWHIDRCSKFFVLVCPLGMQRDDTAPMLRDAHLGKKKKREIFFFNIGLSDQA